MKLLPGDNTEHLTTRIIGDLSSLMGELSEDEDAYEQVAQQREEMISIRQRYTDAQCAKS